MTQPERDGERLTKGTFPKTDLAIKNKFLHLNESIAVIRLQSVSW